MQCANTIFNLRTGLVVLGIICLCSAGCTSDVNYTPAESSTEMAITHYSFGKIVIDGRAYENDIAIYPDGTVQHWRAQVNHAIQLADVKDLMDDNTNALIIGIGANKGCSLTDEIAEYTQSRNIKLHVLDTYEAVKLFNASTKEGLAACFHVNC